MGGRAVPRDFGCQGSIRWFALFIYQRNPGEKDDKGT
jgi:hypothetical protein